MTFSGIPEFNFEDLTFPNNNSYYGANFGFDELNYLDPSKVAGPSEPYMGADVLGELKNYPDFPPPSAAPISLNPAYGVYPNEGKSRYSSQRSTVEDSLSIPGYVPSSYQGMTMLPSPPPPATTPCPLPPYPAFTSPSPIPTLSHGCMCLPTLHRHSLTNFYH
jgi:hypothetical protein